MLLKHRRYVVETQRIDNGWRAGVPALNLWVTHSVRGIARRQLKLKINRAIKLIAQGKAELADSDAVDDNDWWEVRIRACVPPQP